METRPEVKAALFWYRNPAGPVTAIDKLPIPIPSTERSQAVKVTTYPGSSFPDASCPSAKPMDRRFTVLFLMSVGVVPFLKAISGNVPPQRRRCQPVPEKSKSGGGELQPRK